MYYVYIIQSTETYEIYVGYTNNLKKRLVEHNTNKSYSTKNKGPWKLIYYESYANKEDAITREKRLKYHGQALARLKKRIGKSLLLAN
jgi:putative endonuclease